MLAVGRQYSKGTKLATDERGTNDVYYVKNQEYPLQKPSRDVLSMVDPEWLLVNFKKYGLKKDEIRLLMKLY